eukprot:scaffold8649_cov185-Amphora_coffeaeformis.AAC.8
MKLPILGTTRPLVSCQPIDIVQQTKLVSLPENKSIQVMESNATPGNGLESKHNDSFMDEDIMPSVEETEVSLSTGKLVEKYPPPVGAISTTTNGWVNTVSLTSAKEEGGGGASLLMQDSKNRELGNHQDSYMDEEMEISFMHAVEDSSSDGTLVEESSPPACASAGEATAAEAVEAPSTTNGWVNLQEDPGDEEMVSVGTGDSSVMEFEEDVEEGETQGGIMLLSHKISRKFDLPLLQQSMDKGSAVLKGIKEKDMVLVVGKTGTGKSTLIQALAGSKLYATEYETTSYGQTFFKTVFESQTPLPGFEIGHKKSSQTRHINSYTTIVARKDGSKKELVYVDSPGFEDTEGSEVDIATAVMLSQVAKLARSLRFIILINYVSLLEDRGGSLRGILKLVRSFVADFESSKKSFMFLFTHTDDIEGMCGETLDFAKQCLLQEIFMMCESTRDKEVTPVLSFIRMSLQRGYGFVDVFHPFNSDATVLQKNIKKLATVSGDHLARNCGITPTSKFKLTGEMSSLLQELRSVLREDFVDISQAMSILGTFQTLQHYIDIDCVCKMAQDVEDVVDKFLDSRKENLLLEMERGTSGRHTFGDANIQAILQYAADLKSFAEIFPSKVDFDAFFRGVKQELKAFGERLVEQSHSSLEGLDQGLGALLVWSKGFPEFTPIYENSKSGVSLLMKTAAIHVEAFFKTALETATSDQLYIFIQNLKFLEAVAAHSELITQHIDLTEVLRVYRSAIDGIATEMDAWGQIDDLKLLEAAKAKAEVDSLVNRACVIENLYVLLGTTHILGGLAKQCGLVRRALADVATTYLRTACRQMKLAPYSAPDEVQKHISFLAEMHQKYQSVPNEKWNDSLISFRSAVDYWKEFLKSKSGELEGMFSTISIEGMKHGKRASHALAQLQAYTFFDLFLPARDRFVRNCCTAFTRSVLERAERVALEIDHCIAQIESSKKCPYDELRAMGGLFKEETEISFFAHVLSDPSLADAVGSTKERLSLYVNRRIEQFEGELGRWVEALKNDGDDILILTESLDTIIAECEIFSKMAVEEEMVTALKKKTKEACEEFVEFSRSRFAHPHRYPAKKHCLSIIAKISEASFDRGRLPLPGIEESKMKVREGIKQLALEIESTIEQTSCWEKIDSLMEKLEKAKTLDDFTSSEASSRIGPLQKLREKKKENVSEIVDSLIEANNFKGIAAFLLPSATSKDQLVKQEFNRNITRISNSLKETDEDVRRRLNNTHLTDDDYLAVSEGLKILSEANEEVGSYLSNIERSVRLETMLNSAMNKINKKFGKYVDPIFQAAPSFDFTSLCRNRDLFQTFYGHLHLFLSDFSIRNFEKAIKICTETLASVPSELSSFFESNFKKDNLVRLLPHLKVAAEQDFFEGNEITKLYNVTTSKLTDLLKSFLSNLQAHVSSVRCFDDAIEVLEILVRHFQKGLAEHVISLAIVASVQDQMERWRDERAQLMHSSVEGRISEEKVAEWKSLLDKQNPSSFRAKVVGFFNFSDTKRSYDSFRTSISEKIKETVFDGFTNLRNRDYHLAQECIDALELIQSYLSGHNIVSAGRGADELKQEAQNLYDNLCEQAKSVLQSPSRRLEFQDIFEKYRALTIAVPYVTKSESSMRKFSLTNQLIFEALSNDISELHEWESSFDFLSLKTKIDQVRTFGEYLADYGALFREEVQCSEHLNVGKWLPKLYNVCVEHFSDGRNFSRMAMYHLLGVPPSATKRDIRRAYKAKARQTHPDKQNFASQGSNESDLFRKIKEACDTLCLTAPDERPKSNSFKSLLTGIDPKLREKVRSFLSEQKYSEVEFILFRLGDLHVLDDVVVPSLELSFRTSVKVKEMVKAHVDQIKQEIHSNWASRKYQAVNENINDLKQMEESFKSYSDVFSEWNSGIYKRIEMEIEHLGQKARKFLSDQVTATNSMHEFRRCFLNMGSVMYELSPFKEYCKHIMGEVLNACLGEPWGSSYLFEFGLSLQRSDENCTEEENLIAQVIISEFSHFKEVITMVWNEETSQKPAEDTVRDIRGQRRKTGRVENVRIDHSLLLDSFLCFEGEYKALLGEFLPTCADLESLVQRVISLAESLKPISCGSSWSGETKKKIPHLLAGVFSLFTILHSGASYNRAREGDEEMGEKVLMKPHNIQVLTLLCMFGCSSVGMDELESQMLQIRTGEGKSMILGAAAVMLGLLGFRVRCVCYSEYLSMRDYNLFRGVFERFYLTSFITYSKITTLSEDTTAAKGDIRQLTDKLLRGGLPKETKPVKVKSSLAPESQASVENLRSLPSTTGESEESSQSGVLQQIRHECASNSKAVAMKSSSNGNATRQQVLLVDEVDVFFGSEFYGQTYNQVVQVHEPEIGTILEYIWSVNGSSGRRLCLSDIKSTPAYKTIGKKYFVLLVQLCTRLMFLMNFSRKTQGLPTSCGW